MGKTMHTQSKKPNSSRNERGSALWFVLFVLVLIGLLTAFLSRSGSSVDQSADVEQQRIKINQMLRYVQGIAQAIDQMKLQGISESDLNFSPNAADTANCNRSACKIFHVDGGGLTHQAPPLGVSDTAGAQWIITGSNNAQNVGTNAADLIMMLRNVNPTYCAQINRILNVTMGAPDTAIDFTVFNGAYTASETLNAANGHQAGCFVFNDGGTAENVFYRVLVAR
jgi:type II secretory pathway pseudopilin PulG